MECTSPNWAWDCGFKENGKKNIIFAPEAKAISKSCHPEEYNTYEYKKWVEAANAYGNNLRYGVPKSAKLIPLPCGQCTACRINYSRDWAIRAVKEAEQFSQNWFVTLTFEKEHIEGCYHKYDDTPCKECNKIRKCTGTLNGDHVRDFMKDLRAKWKYYYKLPLKVPREKLDAEGRPIWELLNEDEIGIRFFACGEYGDLNGRPHYHIELFNLPIFDLRVTDEKCNHFGDILYESKMVSDAWGRGNVRIGECNWNTAAYVARYVTKKFKGPGAKEYYEAMGRKPEFTRMSRMPGIGSVAFATMKDNFEATLMQYKTKTKEQVKTTRPCRYYEKLFEKEHKLDLERIKEARLKKMKMAEEIRRQLTSTDEFHYRNIRKENFEARVKALDRNKV